jgi:putative oxidoreductase
MEGWLEKYSSAIYALMRVMVGLLYVCHGTQKLFGFPGGPSQLSNPLLVAAGLIETVGGVLVVGGLWTSVAAFVASGEMATAYFMRHAPGGFWPILNKGELAVLFCFVLLFIASKGSGPLSIDAFRHRRR